MFTLVVCLVVVGLSGAAVLHIVLSDAPQRATPAPHPRRVRLPPLPRRRTAPSTGAPPVEPGAPGAGEGTVVAGSRLRSAALLAGLLAGLGVALAALVVLTMVLAAAALQGALE